MTEYLWRTIADLPIDYEGLASKELQSLAEIWKEQSSKLSNSDALRKFSEELSRRWAIETGIIENLYTMDRGVTEILITQGIQASLIPHGSTNKPVSHVVNLIHDQKAALETVFDYVNHNRELSTSYIKGLHFLLTRHQEAVDGVDTLGNAVQVRLIRGDWKKMPNNPTRPEGEFHEYCPPEHVASEMDNLIELHRVHMELSVPAEIEAAWLHHRFTQIHPFQDGNGRIARALASLIFLRSGWFPLVVDRDNRVEYIQALEVADDGDLKPLVDLFASLQRKAFVKALSISEDLLSREEARRQILQAARDRIESRNEERLRELENVFIMSSSIQSLTEEALRKISKEITEVLRVESPEFFSTIERNVQDSDHYFRSQIIQLARQFDYYADTNTYKAWVRLKVKERRQTDIIISFHCLGVNFVGVMAVSAFVQHKDLSDEGTQLSDRPIPLCNEIFQFSYKETIADVRVRYERWLDRVIDAGLDDWRRQL
jgi:Fic family protein